MEETFKVLVSDKLGEAGIKIFEDEPGIDVDVHTDLTPEELLEEIQHHILEKK